MSEDLTQQASLLGGGKGACVLSGFMRQGEYEGDGQETLGFSLKHCH